MNEQNLTGPRFRSGEEAAAKGRKGGIASGKARLRKKQGRELVRLLLQMKETDPRIVEDLERQGIADRDTIKEVAMHVRQIEKAIRKADTQAYNAVLRAAGYDEQEVNVHTDPQVLPMPQEAFDALSKWAGQPKEEK